MDESMENMQEKRSSIVLINNDSRIFLPVPSKISAILEAGSAPAFLLNPDEGDETYFTGDEDSENEELAEVGKPWDKIFTKSEKVSEPDSISHSSFSVNELPDLLDEKRVSFE